jgi:DMSO/TMAO reductase YedYZ molybdopterin-dependent catalytic subunit
LHLFVILRPHGLRDPLRFQRGPLPEMAHRVTRRRFLAHTTKCAGASLLISAAADAFGALTEANLRTALKKEAVGRQAQADSGLPRDAHGMIVYSEEYITRELPVSFLDSWITPAGRFFVRNNEHMPRIDVADWTLSITGEVAHPLTVTLAELLKMQAHSVTNTLECAGNGRAFFQPRIPGVPWSRGGVGNAVFRGPSLGTLLRQAGVRDAARHVAFRGVALASPDPPFMRSIPIEKALDPDTIVATEMNGLPLTSEHGYPARALVPGWIGSASIKWLTEIRVLQRELQGYFMDSAYRLPAPPTEAAKENRTTSDGARLGKVITSLPVKSIIATPADGSTIDPAAPLRVFGAAWAGESAVARVEVSTDSGQSWQSATLGPEHARYAWRLWEFSWKPPEEGTYLIFSRATDIRGRSQPLDVPWNPGGYLWNAVDRVRVTVGRSGR